MKERLPRAIFLLLIGVILFGGIINVFITAGVVNSDALISIFGAESAVFNTNPIANIYLLPKLIAILFTIVPAMLNPLAGYIFILLASIVFIIDGIRNLIKQS